MGKAAKREEEDENMKRNKVKRTFLFNLKCSY